MSGDDRLNDALESIVRDESPRPALPYLDTEEQAMVRMAQMLRGSSGQEMRPAFAEELHGRVFRSGRISRRTAFLGGIGTLAAGILAGVGLDRFGSLGRASRTRRIVPNTSAWYPVAQLADLSDGAVRTFTAGAVQGFLIRRNGNVHALSRICTHMGCALRFSGRDQALVCPCHGAHFDLHGTMEIGPGGYGSYSLPSLPSIPTRVRGGTVEVLGTRGSSV